MSFLSITFDDPHTTAVTAVLEVLIPKEKKYIQGYPTVVSKKQALRLLPTGIEGITVLAKITDPDYFSYTVKQSMCEAQGISWIAS